MVAWSAGESTEGVTGVVGWAPKMGSGVVVAMGAGRGDAWGGPAELVDGRLPRGTSLVWLAARE
ncbi:MAG: hypothetical protein JO287_03490 [Pseudonocardiales bacterium]|nr:hypothetical protein [Pseudonocardiales bacterium]